MMRTENHVQLQPHGGKFGTIFEQWAIFPLDRMTPREKKITQQMSNRVVCRTGRGGSCHQSSAYVGK